jgi:hypothetical protein
LECFGEASGLVTNFQKSSIIPIFCQEIDALALAAAMQCPVQSFPYNCLGLPLSDKRLCKNDLQPVKVKGLNNGCFSLDKRLILVKHVLSAMHIYQLLVLDPPVWLIKAIDKIRRGFSMEQRGDRTRRKMSSAMEYGLPAA